MNVTRQDEGARDQVAPLPPGTRLRQYELQEPIGQSDTAILYGALDPAWQARMAVREYFPTAFAQRAADGRIASRGPDCDPVFQAGLAAFLDEATLLHDLDHPALVRVTSFWEQDGSAYVAMPRYEGASLKDALRGQAKPREDWLVALVSPLLDALEAVHACGRHHGNISPENVLVLRDGSPLLLELALARRAIAAMAQEGTVVLRPGYAPIEDYANDATLVHGPWSDVYALAAVMYRAMTGSAPLTPVSGLFDDGRSRPLAAASGYSEAILRGVERGLAIRPEQRPQTIAAFRQALGLGSAPITPALQTMRATMRAGQSGTQRAVPVAQAAAAMPADGTPNAPSAPPTQAPADADATRLLAREGTRIDAPRAEPAPRTTVERPAAPATQAWTAHAESSERAAGPSVHPSAPLTAIGGQRPAPAAPQTSPPRTLVASERVAASPAPAPPRSARTPLERSEIEWGWIAVAIAVVLIGIAEGAAVVKVVTTSEGLHRPALTKSST